MKYAIIGLGNPGKKYEGTRHNVGFAALDNIAKEFSAPMLRGSAQADALVTEVKHAGDTLFFVKPTTFMNNSGIAVRQLSAYFEIPVENILVIYDDVDLSLGDVKFATGRGSGGHRGVQSIINELDSKKFARFRVGITPADESGAADKSQVTIPQKGINPFVMGQFGAEEQAAVEERFPDMVVALEDWLVGEYERLMNHLH